MITERTVSGELESIKIPPRPAVLLNIQQAMRAPEPDFLAIEEIISMDVAISASLVKIANNPTLGLSHPVRSIKDALHLLGLDTVKLVVTAIALRQSFSKTRNLERFWDSSARIAHISGWLAGHLPRVGSCIKPDEAFTFGLFRDCGIPILMSMYADYLEILGRANQETSRPFTAVEMDELDLDHTMIGGMLVREWELPAEFCLAVESHHQLEALLGQSVPGVPDSTRYLMALAQLAEHIFQTLTGLNRTCEWAKLGAACLDTLGIDEATVATLAEQARAAEVHTHPAI